MALHGFQSDTVSLSLVPEYKHIIKYVKMNMLQYLLKKYMYRKKHSYIMNLAVHTHDKYSNDLNNDPIKLNPKIWTGLLSNLP